MPDKGKIYTKTGDLGETSLLGGTRVKKSNERVEAYGTIDELNSFLGLLRDQDISDNYKKVLLRIQENLFISEARIAADPDIQHKFLPVLEEKEINFLEDEIDEMNKSLKELTHFILPGGYAPSSLCHVARTVCRRAERRVIRLSVTNQEEIIIIRYLNRLSDYLFVLARKTGKDAGADETIWNPLHQRKNNN
jgi:cob(I)alamin adenosyltransferase